MIQGNWFIRLSLCGVTGWAALIWALGRQDKTPTEARSPEGMSYARGLAEGLGQRAMLWLASLAGFYSLIWLLDNVPTRQQEAKVSSWYQAAESTSPLEPPEMEMGRGCPCYLLDGRDSSLHPLNADMQLKASTDEPMKLPEVESVVLLRKNRYSSVHNCQEPASLKFRLLWQAKVLLGLFPSQRHKNSSAKNELI